MKKLITPMPAGGAPFNNEDVYDLFQKDIWESMEALLNRYASDTEGIVVSGCVVSANGGNFDITAGIVFINGEYQRLAAATNQTYTKYIVADSPLTTQRNFQDLSNKDFMVEKKAILSGTSSGQYITIDTVNGLEDRRLKNLPLLASDSKGTNYTLVIGDAGKMIRMDGGGGTNNLTIPPFSSVPFVPGTQILVVQGSGNQTTLLPGSGVSLLSENGALKISGQYGGCALVNIGTNSWLVFGSMTA
jgi:hypothetical protein